MSKKNDLIEKIRADLEKSGYPLEINVMKKLMRFGWNTIPQHYFVDPDEGKGRSLDFYCVKRVEIDSSYFDALRFVLLIECKKIEKKNWVFFVMDRPDSWNKPLRLVGYAKIHQRSKKPGISRYEVLKHSHYLKYRKVAINHYLAHKGEPQTDKVYEATQQVLKALIDDRLGLEKYDLPKNYICSFYYPTIITDKEIFEYDIQTDEISATNQVLYQRAGISRWAEPFLIDIATLEQTPLLLKDISIETEEITRAFQQIT